MHTVDPRAPRSSHEDRPIFGSSPHASSTIVIVTPILGLACSRSGRPPVPPAPAAASRLTDARPTRDTLIQVDNDRMMADVLARLGDRATLPASQVFQNIQVLPNTPARTLLVIMNLGYAKALGVRCTHCHVEGNFASDDKRPKRAAREMAAMHRMINDRLQAMENLELPKPNRFINCSTCHRGMINPLADSIAAALNEPAGPVRLEDSS